MINSYYKNLIDTLIESNKLELASQSPGHCIKIAGFGLSELDYLLSNVKSSFPQLDSYIISDTISDDINYISPTKLIELRNNQQKPLLILIPSNSRTAAEDSYGNNTFKEIPLDGLDLNLLNKLLLRIPDAFKSEIEEIFDYLKEFKVSVTSKINYLLFLENNYTKEKVGNALFFLHLIPDSKLLEDGKRIRYRLNYNKKCIDVLSSFNKSAYDRIVELPLKHNTLQRDLIEFFRGESSAKTNSIICSLIFEKYNNLNFQNWTIPDLEFTDLKVFVDDITSRNFKEEEGQKILKGEQNKATSVRIRIRTNPAPKDKIELKYFRVVLMSINGTSGDEILTLRKVKCTAGGKNYRDITVDIDPSMIEQGSYYLSVFAEDEHNNILNLDDDFKDYNVQKLWDEKRLEDNTLEKKSFPYKKTSDSDDFYYVIEEVSSPDEQRKDKVQSILQAYYKYRIDQLKRKEEQALPTPSESSNLWLNDNLSNLKGIFYINYSNKHNYQVNISNKLRALETLLLDNSKDFGFLSVTLSNNHSSPGFQSEAFHRSILNEAVPKGLLDSRIKLFKRIKASNEDNNGIFETADVFNFTTEVKEYISKLTNWTTELKGKLNDSALSLEEKAHLHVVLTQLQYLDIISVHSKLPDGSPLHAKLISPLHPLRLAWNIQLFEVFENWESKTIVDERLIKDWIRNLEEFFYGELYPENNPLVIVEPESYHSYVYGGELSFGWGIYLNMEEQQESKTATSITRQLKYYVRELLNIPYEGYVDTDVSKTLVSRHLVNYLKQHPYIERIIINLFNAGDAGVFAEAMVDLEGMPSFKEIKYEVRIFKGYDKIFEHGSSLKNLINPESIISEEAEAFSQPSINRLFPKLRFSINNLSDYLSNPSNYTANISFVISPFPLRVELIKPEVEETCFHLNGVITNPSVAFIQEGNELRWNRYISSKDNKLCTDFGKIGIELFNNIQTFIAGALATRNTDSIPATQLVIKERDNVLINHLHDTSDWVVVFDKNLGPQIFDQPSKDGQIPFLLDYIPGVDVSGISSYLTTRPTAEVLGLLGPHFSDFDLNIHRPEDEKKIKTLLEDLRAVSSSLVLQLNSTKNKAFEVIGSAFTKRFLEKKGFLKDAFLVPIDLHKSYFENLNSESKSRADNLLIGIDIKRKEIVCTVIEIKCRKLLSDLERIDLKSKIKSQIVNTIEALSSRFDPIYNENYDCLDREIRNKELKVFLDFYLERARRYEYIEESAYLSYKLFLNNLNHGFTLAFKQLGLIFDFSAINKHVKEKIDDELTIFTIGHKLINQILDPDSDLNTRRLENEELEKELREVIGENSSLKEFVRRFQKSKETSYITLGINTNEIDINNKEQDSKEEGIVVNVNPIDINPIDIGPPGCENENHVLASKEDCDDYPSYDVLLGKSTESNQFGLLGKSVNGKKLAIDLSETNTISLFGVQGGGKSYSIGIVSEMVLKQSSNINRLPWPLAGVIFHYSDSIDYAPEFTSMIYPNDKIDELQKLKEQYGANPGKIEDVILLAPKDKVEERQKEYPSLSILPITFSSMELSVSDWLFLLGAIGNDSTYIKQLKALMKENRKSLSINTIEKSIDESQLLSANQKALAKQRLSFARDYIDDQSSLRSILKPGRLVIVDLRDEFIVKEEALGLFVIMLNVFSSVKEYEGKRFNKFIVFDEAHKYMDNADLTDTIVTAIREMRHKGVNIMIASQDPPSLPNAIIELSSIVLLHKFNSPQWLKHIQKSVTQMSILTPSDLSALSPGEGYVWSNKATDKSVTSRPIKVYTRPRVTKHGGATKNAAGY